MGDWKYKILQAVYLSAGLIGNFFQVNRLLKVFSLILHLKFCWFSIFSKTIATLFLTTFVLIMSISFKFSRRVTWNLINDSNRNRAKQNTQALFFFTSFSCDTIRAYSIKAGSHRSRLRQRYRSVAVTSNVKVFTQKILAVTEVIFLISSVLRWVKIILTLRK